MKKTVLSFFIVSLVFPLLVWAVNPGDYTDDPDIKKMLAGQQEINKKIPAELLSLQPAGLKVVSSNYSREATQDSTITFSLNCSETGDMSVLEINLTAFNLKNESGEYYAKYAVPEQRKSVVERWMTEHQAGKKDYTTRYEPAVIAVPNGKIYIQKIFADKHGDGEGDVLAKTTYEGFLIMDWKWGYLNAVTGKNEESQAKVEKWLRSVAASAAKLDGAKLFR